MKRILITGAGSYVGESVRKYMLATAPGEFEIDAVDTMNYAWRNADFSLYDTVYHVAGIAHVDADPRMEPLYYKVNRDLAVEVAKSAKMGGVKQFIFMSSQIVFHESSSLKAEVITETTKERPNGFYGDSKLQAEIGLRKLESADFKVCILRPPMIYGPNSKGNFPRLAKLAVMTPIFPCWHNRRSMCYIDNLAEFVKQAVSRRLSGTFYPQNREFADTVEIVRCLAKSQGHKIWITSLLNPAVWAGSFFIRQINKMFGTYYYAPEMSKMDFEYQLVGFAESLRIVAEHIKEKND